MRFRLDKSTRRIVATGLLFTLAMAGIYLYQPTFYTYLEQKANDALLMQTHRQRTSGVPVVVDIDAKAVAEFGPWPWPRHRIAKLLTELERLGARSIGLDMVLAEADPSSPQAMLNQLGRDWDLQIKFEGLPTTHHDTDQRLASVLQKGPHALGYFFKYDTPDAVVSCRLHPLIGVFDPVDKTLSDTLQLRRATHTICNLDVLSEVANASGFLNHFPDSDGVLRKMPLIVSHRGELYPSLALATLMQYLEVEEIKMAPAQKGSLRLLMKDFSIPIDKQGNMLIHFRGKGKTFDYFSAADVLDAKVAPDRLKGKIVFVGPHVSKFSRLRATPLDDEFPAIELHATVVDNILTEDHIHRPGFAVALELALMIGFGLLATLFLSRTGSKWSLLVLGGCVLGIWGGAHGVIRAMGIMISPIAPLIAFAGNFTILTLFKYAREERRLKQSMLELSQTQAAAIRGLATLAETRDPETGGHILRTQRYVKVLAQQLRQNPDFATVLDDQVIDQFFKMAPLHDIGKVGIPDNILLKPGRLSDEEFEIMKRHTDLGRRALEMAQQEMAANPFFLYAIEIANCHQEKWDGSGYPQGLQGPNIPLSARLMAVADVYDALISKRVYKPPMPHNKAAQIIFEGKGIHFDPDLIDAFEQIQDRFRAIAHEFADYEEERQGLRK